MPGRREEGERGEKPAPEQTAHTVRQPLRGATASPAASREPLAARAIAKTPEAIDPPTVLVPGPRRDKWEAAQPIVIGDNVWLGGGAIVLAVVTIGANTVVGAGAVVRRDLPADVVAVGSPARVVRHL